ncbi:MAG: DUF4255 domain-containing protein [Planctomycetes bacterium]|nr:DUF4255 domain-containing protein [Planctomycetota bacterium]
MASPTILRDVTAALTRALAEGLGEGAGRPAQVLDSLPPQDTPAAPALSVLLYQVAENAMLRKRERTVEEETGEGGEVREFYRWPPLVLDLRYLVSAWAKDVLAAQGLLGRALQVLHDTPLLGVVSEEEGPVVHEPSLKPYPMDVDTLGGLWRTLGRAYRPAFAYQVTVILPSERKEYLTRVRERVVDMRRKS